MKKFYSLMTMSLLALSSWAGTVTFDFSSAEGLAKMGITAPAQSKGVDITSLTTPAAIDGVTLTATNGATNTRVWNSQGTLTLRVYVDGAVTFSVAEGSITAVTINAASATNFTLAASNGTYTTTGETVGSWTGSTNSISFSHTGAKNAQIASVVVTTSDEDPTDTGGGGFTPDPTKYQLDSIAYLYDLEDNTEFQFTKDLYVNYVNGKYLYLLQMDSEGYIYAGLVYGDTGKEYNMGDVIPAGWTAKKTTYNGLVEAISPAGFENSVATVDEDYYSAIDCTGYLDEVADPEEYWELYKIYLEGVTLTAPDDKGNFTVTGLGSEGDTITINGINKFNIDLPAEPVEEYVIEAMVNNYNGTIELFPIAVEEFENEAHLWYNYYGMLDEDVKYTLMDSLVVAASLPEQKLIYVTDNAQSIYYDVYADYGYAEWIDWYPDWVALDLTGNDELFNQLSKMNVIAPGTVKGTFKDLDTNPRFIVSSTPAVLDVEETDPLVYEYDLTNSEYGFYPNAQEVLVVKGVYAETQGVAQLTSGEAEGIALDVKYDYAPTLAGTIKAGDTVDALAIAKVKEAWEVSYKAPARVAAKAAPVKKVAAREAVEIPAVAPRKSIATMVNQNDENYYTNYEVYLLQVDIISAVEDLNANKTVKAVEYINALGQVSAEPHNGFNLVKTTYTDGTTATVKVLR